MVRHPEADVNKLICDRRVDESRPAALQLKGPRLGRRVVAEEELDLDGVSSEHVEHVLVQEEPAQTDFAGAKAADLRTSRLSGEEAGERATERERDALRSMRA